jgi:hypothetical protein
MEPKDLKKVGTCKKCHKSIYYSESQPTSENSNVGDYDFVCYPCQFELMDNGKWESFKNKHLHSL